MRSLEIICHCYSEQIPDFASMLTAQLSSIIRHPPSTGEVVITVCTTATDRLTRDVCAAMAYKMKGNRAARLDGKSNGLAPMILIELLLDKSLLFRRAIGRNIRARRTISDVAWWADADYLVGPGTLDAMLAVECDTLWHPKEVMIHTSHAEGDEFLRGVIPGEMVEGNLGRFQPHRVKMAIGGLQFVPGSIARAKGYLDQTRWTKPVDPAGGFRDTKEDRVFRGTFERSESFEIPNLLRLRHSKSAFQDAETRLAQTAGQ